MKILTGKAVLRVPSYCLSSAGSFSLSWSPKFRSNMSGQADPVDFSGRMLDLEEDEDLEVFTKVRIKPQTSRIPVKRVPLLVRCCTIPTCKCLLANKAEDDRDLRKVPLSADG